MRDVLAAVRDPALRRPLTELGFIAGVTIDGGWVHVRLRLPSYAAVESASAVAADTRAAVAALAWVRAVTVCVVEPTTPGERDAADHACGPVPPLDGAGDPGH